PAHRFGGDQHGQVAHVVGVEATAHGEHDVAVCAPLDFQHRSSLCAENASATPAQNVESTWVGWIGDWRTSPIDEILDNKTDWCGRSPPETVLVDPERADFRFECRARNAEPRRGPGGSVDASAAGPQRILDEGL